MNLKNLMMWGVIVLLVAGLFQLFQNPKNSMVSDKMPFSEFLKNINDGRVVRVEIRGNDISFSPNDDFLTVCGHDNKNYGHYGLQRIWLINVKENTKRCLTANIDISYPFQAASRRL